MERDVSLRVTLVFVGACFVSETFAFKVDRNLVRPYRNFAGRMHERDFLTPQDFQMWISEQTTGFGKMFVFEDPKDW